ncbi:unnamed protein product [Paramecium primaurelia]|uniref:Transmembrane protein n=1 Tax=Paramecium primaurelia TaxID=5886 RepID=A0A8S1PYP1_PARPR|nr:unnamed protein product [Paramecium primaurelia]
MLLCFGYSFLILMIIKIRNLKTFQNYQQLNSENINISSQITNFINKCMRIYIPVPNLVEREVKQDHKVEDYFGKNSEIQISLIQNNQDIIFLFTKMRNRLN